MILYNESFFELNKTIGLVVCTLHGLTVDKYISVEKMFSLGENRGVTGL